MSDKTTSTTGHALRLGYIGMGAMGSQMAARLAAVGFEVTVWSRNMARAEALKDKGVKVAPTAEGLAAQVDVLLSCVTDDAAVSDLYWGPRGILGAIKPATTVMEMSTILPATSRELARRAQERGVAVLDAPVSGSVNHAGQGQLVIFAGGAAAAFERCGPIFKALSRAHFHMGENGAGATMKLLVNAILGTAMETLAEAIAFGQAGGLDRLTLLNALGETTVINPSQKAKLENIKAEKYPTTFALRLMAKDFTLITQLAAQNKVPVPTISAAANMSLAALKALDPNDDYSATIKFVEKMGGIGAKD